MANVLGSRVPGEEALINELLRVNDSDFSRIMHIHQSGRAEENYGPAIARLMTPALLEYVAHKRGRAGLGDPRGLPSYPQRVDRREWDMMQNVHIPYDGINKHALRDAAIRRPENAREARLVEMLDNAERRLAEAEKIASVERENTANIRKTFLQLFGESVVESSATVQQVPTESVADVRGWRVRIHVPAFTVETTMGALTAAKGAPGAAMTWGHDLTLQRDVYSRALEEALTHISTHIITGNHPIESAEPETPQEPI